MIEKEFRELITEKKQLDSLLALLQWDLETKTPIKGVKNISKLIGEISLKSYNLTTSERMINLIKSLKKKSNLSEIIKKEIEILEKEIEKIKVIPADEYQTYSELTAEAQSVWEKAKNENNYKLFEPYLKKIFDYNKKFIEYRGIKNDIYSAILDDYENGMNTEKLDKIFLELKNEIVPLLKKITEKNSQNQKLNFFAKKEKQKNFSRELLGYLGFDFERGLLDESEHPFTLTVNRDDIRLTTKYIEDLPFSSIFSTIHEGGHGIYEQGIGTELSNTLLDDGISMGIHESQSRFYENIIGRNKKFWKNFLQKSKYKYDVLNDIDIDKFYKEINHVAPSPIRIEADELTYSLHIIIRYEIEKGVLNGEFNFEDIVTIWNNKTKEYLGIEVKNDQEGILQDVHWSCGLIGYFPSYALGNLYSSQIFNSLKRDLNFEKILENGEMEKIREWLKDKIYKYGKLKNPNDLIYEISNEELNSKYYIDYLKQKYSELYEL